MSELLREIEEDIQRERLLAFWRSFGNLMVGASLVVIVGTIGVVGWQHYRTGQQQERTAAFGVAMDQLKLGQNETAAKSFAALKNGSDGLAGLAALREAELLKALGKKDEALNAYNAIASNHSADAALRELARLRAQALGGDGTAKPAPDQPFFYSASEAAASKALHDGKKDEAVALLSQLEADADTPESLRQRASEILTPIKPKAAKDSSDAATTQP